jgi:branched-chain amino acid transport system permease protein
MQILVNGLISGLILAVLALGFTAVYLPLKIFYLALGAVYTIVPFLVWGMMQAGWPWYLASVVAIGVGIGISLSCEWLNHSRLERQGASSGAHLISSLGIYIVVVQTVAMTWGNETKVLRAGLDGVLQLGGVTVTYAQVTGAIVSVVMLGGFLLWLQYSQLGLKFRAVADNAREFALRGYNVDRLRLLAFGLAGGMAGVSSLLVAYDIGFDPNGGLAAVLLAVVAVIIGGQRSFWGPICGGILLGVVRSQVVWFLSARWQEAVTFAILALFLFLRPQGLFGQKMRLEAEE